MSADLLPDSRLHTNHTARNRVFRGSQAWVPVFCANCGKEGGWCPEEGMTFMFYQCYPCAEKMGPVPGTYQTPDDVFYKELADAQMAEVGRPLTQTEIAQLAGDTSAFARLILEGK